MICKIITSKNTMVKIKKLPGATTRRSLADTKKKTFPIVIAAAGLDPEMRISEILYFKRSWCIKLGKKIDATEAKYSLTPMHSQIQTIMTRVLAMICCWSAGRLFMYALKEWIQNCKLQNVTLTKYNFNSKHEKQRVLGKIKLYLHPF